MKKNIFLKSRVIFLILFVVVLIFTIILINKVNNENKESGFSEVKDYVVNGICKAITEDMKTVGNVPAGEYKQGDEYICEVKDGVEYRFFVLSSDEHYVNLILERNVYYDSKKDVGGLATSSNKGLVAWFSVEYDNTKGPVAAMTYLYNATKDWDNIPNIVISYKSESNSEKYGYGTIKTDSEITNITNKDGSIITASFKNLKARMPYKSEIMPFSSDNLWMYNYLNKNNNVKGEGLKNINGINGYWTLSATDFSSCAWLVYFRGNEYNTFVNYSSDYGVRPVITISKSDIE